MIRSGKMLIAPVVVVLVLVIGSQLGANVLSLEVLDEYSRDGVQAPWMALLPSRSPRPESACLWGANARILSDPRGQGKG